MPIFFKPYDNVKDIAFSWKDLTPCTGIFVDEKGQPISHEYLGRQYQLLATKEHIYSDAEKNQRKRIAVAYPIAAFALAFFATTLSVLTRTSQSLLSASLYGLEGGLLVSALCMVIFNKKIKTLFRSENETTQLGVYAPPTPRRISEGKVIFINPLPLFDDTPINSDKYLNFVEIIDVGGKWLAPMVAYGEDSGVYTPFEGTWSEALYHISKNPQLIISTVSIVLNDPLNTQLPTQQFLEFLTKLDDAKCPRLYSLHEKCLIDVLELLIKNGVKVDLKIPTASGKSLLVEWIEKCHPEIVKLIMKADPTTIEQINKYLLIETLPKNREIGALLLEAVQASKHFELNHETLWLKSAALGHCEFADNEYKALYPNFKRRLFYVANKYGSLNFVKKMKDLGYKNSPATPKAKQLVASNADIEVTRNAISNFFLQLRVERLLKSKSEFAPYLSTYISMGEKIDQWMGKDLILEVVQAERLDSVHVARQMFVFDHEKPSISFQINSNLWPDSYSVSAEESPLSIYVEHIPPSDRKITMKEALELMKVCVKTGFSGQLDQNVVIGHNGIYFTNTEMKNFNPSQPNWEQIQSIKGWLLLELQNLFQQEFDKIKAAWEVRAKTLPQESSAPHDDIDYKLIAQAIPSTALSFSINELTTLRL